MTTDEIHGLKGEGGMVTPEIPASCIPGTESLEATLWSYMPYTQLWQHIQHEPANSTVIEYDFPVGEPDEEGERQRCRVVELVKYTSVLVDGVDDPGAKSRACLRLALKVDDLLLTGLDHEDEDAHFREIAGLAHYARKGAPRARRRARIQTLEREQFWERYQDEKRDRSLRLFSTMRAESVNEGDLPSVPYTFAVGDYSLAWRQLLPCMFIPLVSLDMRDGSLYPPIDNRLQLDPQNDDKPVEPPEGMLRKRGVVLVYGCLELRDPDSIFMLAR